MGPDFIIIWFLVFCFFIGLIACSIMLYQLIKNINNNPRDIDYWVLFFVFVLKFCICLFMMYFIITVQII